MCKVGTMLVGDLYGVEGGTYVWGTFCWGVGGTPVYGPFCCKDTCMVGDINILLGGH